MTDEGDSAKNFSIENVRPCKAEPFSPQVCFMDGNLAGTNGCSWSLEVMQC